MKNQSKQQSVSADGESANRASRLPPTFLAAAMNNLPVELSAIHQKLWNLHDKLAQRVMQTIYAIGFIVARCSDHLIVAGKPRRLTKPLNLLAEALGVHRDFIADARRLAINIAPDEFAELTSRAPIHIGHMHLLATVPTPDRRRQLANQIVNENLDSAELSRRMGGRAKKEKTKRKPKPPKNLKQGVAAALAKTKALSDVYEQSLFADHYDLAGEVIYGAPEKLTPEVVSQLHDAVAAMQALAAQAAANGERLQRAIAVRAVDEPQLTTEVGLVTAAPQMSAVDGVPMLPKPIRILRT